MKVSMVCEADPSLYELIAVQKLKSLLHLFNEIHFHFYRWLFLWAVLPAYLMIFNSTPTFNEINSLVCIKSISSPDTYVLYTFKKPVV